MKQTTSEKPSPRVMISARDLKDILRDELYDVQAKLKDPDDLPNERIKEIAKTIVNRALLSPR
jgi:hypothetical protein